MSAAAGEYDPIELRRRIAVCFSVGELRALAESLGVGGIAWERGIDEAAREVVKQSERYAGLPALVARLREARPLVEWPEPAAGRPVPPTFLAAMPLPTLASATDEPAPDSATHAAGPPGPPGPPGTLVGGFAPNVMPAAVSRPPPTNVQPAMPGPDPAFAPRVMADPYAAPSASAPPSTAQVKMGDIPVAPASSAPPRAGWPGTAQAAVATAPSGVDPRILIAVAGLTLAAAILAYVAGRASSASNASAAASASAQAAAAAARGDGPANRAAIAIAQSFANLARVCELPTSAGGNELVFRRVFERCGRGPAQRRPSSSSPSVATTPEPTDAPPPDRGRAPRGGRGDGPPAPAPARGCMATCDALHASCRARCGPEPVESSAYAGYQHCQGSCLTDASRCRLSCH